MIIITVPHVCQKRLYDPGCDQQALEFARLLHSILPSVLVDSRELRKECDNNRVECRNTDMRRKLTEILSSPEQIDLLIDVHTFPRAGFPTLGDVVLIGPLARKLARKIRNRVNLDYVIEECSPYDIITHADELGIPAVLIEFADDIPTMVVCTVAKIFSEL